ncbi:hypothetical protein ShirakiTB12_05750 [Priestia megaterium]|uniref:Sporulation protein YjcZ n=3 Tax=Priestia TaxID=2800373 RepID=A0AAX6BEE2_PRIMG|nr:hypothetical protein ShirakiTB12_05750 [Priestia megaterium]
MLSLRVGCPARSLRNTLYNVVDPQGREELSQMILRSLSRNILRRPSILFKWLSLQRKSKLEIELKYNIRGAIDMGSYGCGYGSGFALLVVLFILLVIIGASCFC